MSIMAPPTKYGRKRITMRNMGNKGQKNKKNKIDNKTGNKKVILLQA